jgi:hypothetical protein
MAAQILLKNDEKANDAALEKVRKDKEREVKMDMMYLGCTSCISCSCYGRI